MRIALVTQWYDPEVGSAAIPGAIARALQTRGHQVEVITGFPNYPTGALYDGYRVRPYLRESIRGVTVHRVPLYPSHDASALRRVLNFVSFMVSASTLGSSIARRSQVTLIYSTPATVGLAGIVLRTLLRRPFVLLIQDLWPDTLKATGMLPNKWIRPVEWGLHRFCNAVYTRASHIAVTSPGMRTVLIERGVRAQKVDVVYNWVDEDMFQPTQARTLPQDSFDVMYAGNIGEVQGLQVAVRAIAALGASSKVRLRLVGTGVAEDGLKRLATELGVGDRVLFDGAGRIEEMSEVMAGAHVQLVCLKDDPLFHLTMPSKVQASLATGCPVITCAPGDAARLTVESGAGWAVGAGDVDGLAQAMDAASRVPTTELAARGAAGLEFYRRRMAADVGVQLLERALSNARRDTQHDD